MVSDGKRRRSTCVQSFGQELNTAFKCKDMCTVYRMIPRKRRIKKLQKCTE